MISGFSGVSVNELPGVPPPGLGVHLAETQCLRTGLAYFAPPALVGRCALIDVGLVGFGLGGRCFHAPVIQAVDALRLAAIVQRRGDEANRLYPEARVVRSLEELLKIETIQLVVISTPNQTHFPFAMRCLEAGRDVVVDKPFTNTVAEAAELVRKAEKLGRVLTVYHDRRFDADFQALRKLLAAGELGKIVRFEAHYDRYRPKSKTGAWREIPGPGSGILWDLGPHLLDYALNLFGTPERITADVRIEREGFVTDDGFDIWLHYPDRLLAAVGASMLCPVPRSRFVVLGTKGSYLKKKFDPLESELRIHVPGPGESWMLEKRENFGEVMLVDGDRPETRKVESFGDWRDFYANVRDCILGKAELLVTPEQALDVMIAMELARKSSDERRSVNWELAE
jgi:scyllo-inositol 2-dehydrogenase (NADP+)